MASETVSNERWSKAFIGLPNDFLRLSQANVTEGDRETALALQQQMSAYNPIALAANTMGRLSITVAQSKLVKNYGLTRMDPYVRVRVGHYIYETNTDPNGGKTPRWNRVFHTQLPIGVNKIFIEIFDECNFMQDELIAWTEVTIPNAVLERGETHEDWYPLSGKTGEQKEGMIDLVLSFTSAANIAARPMNPQHQPVVFVPNVSGRALPVYIQPQPMQQSIVQQPIVQQPPMSDETLSDLMEIFPSVDREVIKSIGEANQGNKEATINQLLQLTN